MAEYCHSCSLSIFGTDYEDFASLCKEGEHVIVLCEGCGGEIVVDHTGRRVLPSVPPEATHATFRHPTLGGLVVHAHPEADLEHYLDHPGTMVSLHWAKKHAWWLAKGAYIPTYYRAVTTYEPVLPTTTEVEDSP